MKHSIQIIVCIAAAISLLGCGGSNNNTSSGNTGGNAAAAASCNQAPTLGSTSFGNGCFK
jgi:hypothetical protein